MVSMLSILEKISQDKITNQSDSSQVKLFLVRIIETPSIHALFLNTISLMEHIGSRKILLTQSNEHTTEFILRHASEEARHALFFKKKIEYILPNLNLGYSNHELLAGLSAKIYFQKLDATVRKSIRQMNLSHSNRTYLNYLYTTTAIEIRATYLYKIYNEVLIQRNFGFHLNGLLAEEEGHLAEMESEIQRLDSESKVRLDQLLQQEEKLFRKLWQKWKDACDLVSKP
ncbi:MAG: rubrerythrin [Leptospira sp.]|nr:MAG: rubrerythrin [Leptospira sp.]